MGNTEDDKTITIMIRHKNWRQDKNITVFRKYEMKYNVNRKKNENETKKKAGKTQVLSDVQAITPQQHDVNL